MATGCHLYGDMAGGFAVIKDMAKTFVYRLWHLVPQTGVADVIPERIITRPPSAELRPDQKDQDSLPPYEVLDAIIEALHGANRPEPRRDRAPGLCRPTDVERVGMLQDQRYKRRQARSASA